MELMDCNKQWVSRPSDQRFTSLLDMQRFMRKTRENSMATVVSSRQLNAVPVDGDSNALMVTGPKGVPVTVTNWSFGQLSERAGAPAGYLRSLPAAMAADCINYGLQVVRDAESIGILVQRTEQGGIELRAATGPKYGRIWCSSIVDTLVEYFGDGVNGNWRVPGVRGQRVEITKDNTTLYASDRDMFVFLANEDNRVTLPNRRDGKSGTLAQGFFLQNSDVGGGKCKVKRFLNDYTCGNRIVWGAQNVEEIDIIHFANAPDKWLDKARPALEALAKATDIPPLSMLEAAQKAKIDKVDEFLMNRFTKSQTGAIKLAHLADENRPIETLWDAATGVTAFARSVAWQDERVKLETEAGKILDLAI